MEDVGAYLFLLSVFVVLFGVPIWLMIRHHKKSKIKMAKLQAERAKETPEQAQARKQEHNSHVASVIGIVAGVLIGSRLLGEPLLGMVLGAVLGGVGGYIVDKLSSKQ